MNKLTTLAVALSIAALAACGQVPTRDDARLAAARGPATPPQRNVTDFSDTLRCMDDLFLRYGTRDVSVLMEDLSDSTKKVSAGTRDMMISAISDMTRRSRAIQLITFGQDANNIVAFLNNAQQKTAFGVVPQYNLRGSVSQLDENVLKRQADFGLSLEPLLSLGSSKSAQFNVLGLDVSMAQTSNLALLPGVSSKNLVVIAKDGKALDSQATIRKIGINFSTNFQRTDGTAQALRNMVELSAAELFGRLTKLPYWSCLGAGPDNAEVKREIEDWFVGMDRSGELVSWFQEQLRNRGFYDGPADGVPNEALRNAIVAYRRASGLAELDYVDLAFFTDFLHRPFPPAPAEPFVAEAAVPAVRAATPAKLAASPVQSSALVPTATTGVRPIAPPKVASTPSALPAGAAALAATPELEILPVRAVSALSNRMSLQVVSSGNGYLYCYHQDASQRIRRIFPNRHTKDPRIQANKPIALPGLLPVGLPGADGSKEAVACFVASREIYYSIPAALRWGDYESLNVNTFERVGAILELVAKQPIAHAEFTIDPTKLMTARRQ